MLKRLAFAVATTAVLALASPPASAASFDCAKAAAPHEKAICADPRLSQADVEMGRLYRQVLAAAPGSGVKQDQRAWLARTRDCGADAACLLPLYRTRIETLRQAALNNFLGADLEEPGTETDVAWTDLNGDGRPEAVVWLTGPGWCGSGGCVLLVLEPTADSFTIRGRVTLTQAPIGFLKSSSRGWRDLVVGIGGGGRKSGQIVLPFLGERYAGNPTIEPARPLAAGQKPEILIDGR